jgi:hypothetical protein
MFQLKSWDSDNCCCWFIVDDEGSCSWFDGKCLADFWYWFNKLLNGNAFIQWWVGHGYLYISVDGVLWVKIWCLRRE